MDRLGRFAASWGGRFAAVTVAVALSGCTMCPDPYDYSGPVPNGSAPQNNFRARSNGILPIGGTARPWPPLVGKRPPGHRHQAGCRCGRRHGTPTPADPAVTQAAVMEPIPEQDEPTSVLVAAAVDEMGEQADDEPIVQEIAVEERAEEAPALIVLGEDELDATAASHPDQTEVPVVEAAEVVAPDLPEATPDGAAASRLSETPGWRTRRVR
ncbi:MAG: hypothetical protein ACKOC8_11195 [Pirellulales bacterium]